MTLAQRAPTLPLTVEQFRDWAARQPGKWELVDGTPRAMAPASSSMASGGVASGTGLMTTRSDELSRTERREKWP